jgi:tRNA(fMet)-specific endonuclease VapC
MIIAGQALEDELILVTDNVKHFNRIPDLKVENWLSR